MFGSRVLFQKKKEETSSSKKAFESDQQSPTGSTSTTIFNRIGQDRIDQPVRSQLKSIGFLSISIINGIHSRWSKQSLLQ